MLIGLSNTPRDYAWGSTTLIAELEGRDPSGVPEAEVWFGDHPGSPARVEDGTGRTLDTWLAECGEIAPLPYLLKVLAAASPLSIQAHPSKAQAEEGFAREDAAGIDRAAPGRNYRDDNHKPELIVAISERFEALAGLRDLDATRRLLRAIGDATAPLAARLDGADAAAAIRETLGWLLSEDASDDVAAIIGATSRADSDEFAAELAVSRRLAEAYPGDPGVVVALLMNYVSLRRGEAVFVRAGVLHAYLAGLGVELMAASDNVLRGGLTPKHIDVPELLALVDTTTGPAPLLEPAAIGERVQRFSGGVADFALLRAVSTDADETVAELSGTAIVLVTSGEVTVHGAGASAPTSLRPGQALLATMDESPLRLSGDGEVFIAEPGA